MKVNNTAILACAAVVFSSSGIAGYIELGNEYEDWREQEQRTNTMPYIAMEFNPIEDSSMFLYANFSYRHMIESDERTWNNRARQDVAIGWSEGYEDFWWGPKFQIRMRCMPTTHAGPNIAFITIWLIT